MNIIGKRRLFYAISLVLVVLSAVTLVTQGLNLGIDFTGGTLLERGFSRDVTVAEVRRALDVPALAALDLGQPTVQSIGDREMLIRVRPLDDDGIARVDEALATAFGEVEDRRTEVVGPVIGDELVRKALLALGIASLIILGYVSVRFQFWFGVAAIIALLHDVLITLGVFSFTGREINTPFVAAILTVVGYSINDTIVVFDRIRENLALHPRMETEELVNTSIRQTMARSINTSLTTLLVVAPMYFFGGVTTKEVTLALLVGIVVGTYSSIFVASALWLSRHQWAEARAKVMRASAH